MQRSLIAAMLMLGWVPASFGQAPVAPVAPPPDCSGADYRQFDFWLGHWEVTQGGKLAGRNRITRELGDCALREQWQGTRGLAGVSLNFHDRSDGRWHQLWVDGLGAVLRLSGQAPRAGEMRLESDPAVSGPSQRIHWTLREDGVVIQHWEQSSDGGVTWATAFLGEYRRLSDE